MYLFMVLCAIDISQRLVQVSSDHKIHIVIVEKHFYTANVMQY